VIVVPIMVDPNDFKPQINKMIKGQTGRNLTIDGDLGLSLFPNVRLTVGKASLSNVQGFGKKPFLEIRSAEVGVELLPLLEKDLKIQKVALDGLRLNLIRKKDGKINWDNLIAKNSTQVKETNSSKGSSAERAVPTKETPTSKILSGSSKNTSDNSEKIKTLLAGFALGELALTDARIELQDRRSKKQIVLDQIELKIGKVAPGTSTPLNFGLSLSGVQSDKDSRVSVSSNLMLKEDIKGMLLNDLIFQIAAQEVRGNIDINDFNQPEVTFKLNSAQLNFDHVDGVVREFNQASKNQIKNQSKQKKTDAARAVSKTNNKVGATPGIATSAVAVEEPLEVDGIRKLNLSGSLEVGTIVISNLTLQEFSLKLLAKNGLIELSPIKAKAYAGKYNGKVVLDARGNKPVITFTESLKELQAEPFLTDLFKKPARFTGKMDVSGSASADANKPLDTLNGSFRFKFVDGAVKDINIPHMLRVARAKLKGEPAPTDEKKQTDFTSLTGTASIRNGIVDNTDLLVKAPVLRVDGNGSVNLVAESIDYSLTSTLVKSLEGQGGRELKDLVGIPMPIRVSGSFDKPSYKIDMENLMKESGKEAAKRKAVEKLQRKLEKKGLGDLLKF
ncbi:AsmA family protein, partial [Pseudomonadota bacterium]